MRLTIACKAEVGDGQDGLQDPQREGDLLRHDESPGEES